MKRKGTKPEELIPKKKPDATISTDLRSKIGYKLQTLLNGISTDSAWYIRSRKQLYADLIQESQYPEIIIDPTIVVKLEKPEQSLNLISEKTPDFISSAKTRLTELLNKRQDSEKENSTSKSIPPSTAKSKSSIDSSIPKKPQSKQNFTAEISHPSHTEVLINQGQLQNVVTETGSKRTRKKSKTFQSECSQADERRQRHCLKNKTSSHGRKSTSKQKNSVNEDLNHTKKSNMITRNSASYSFAACSNQIEKVANATPPILSHFKTVPAVSNESAFQFNKYTNIDNSTESGNCEIIDVSADCVSVSECSTSVTTVAYSETVLENVTCQPDVAVLDKNQPTFEVINLDEEEEVKIICQKKKSLHKCKQCEKTFFAKSLFNFHLKMHGSDSVSSSLRSKRS